MTPQPSGSLPSSPVQRADLNRREALALLSAAAVPVMLGAPRALAAAVAIGDDSAIALEPGYLLGSHLVVEDPALRRRLNDPREPLAEAFRAALPEEYPLAVVPTGAVGGSAGEITTPQARVWVHGLLPPPRPPRLIDLHSLILTAMTSPAGQGAPFSFHAWSFAASVSGPSSSPTQFVIPVASDVTVRLHLDLVRRPNGVTSPSKPVAAGDDARSATAGDDRLAVTLGDRPVGGAPSLRAGLYLLPLDGASERAMPMAASYDYLVPNDLLFLAYSVAPLAAETE